MELTLDHERKIQDLLNREDETTREALRWMMECTYEVEKCRAFLGAEQDETLFELIQSMIRSLPKLYFE